MTNSSPTDSKQPSDSKSGADPYAGRSMESTIVDNQLDFLSQLVDHREHPEAGDLARQLASLDPSDNQLFEVRLGVASSLFLALRAKHFSTAAHCLRVATTCSAWGAALDLEHHVRDQLEVAALLHDVGKIGVPDFILTNPGKLTYEEHQLINQTRAHGLEILGACCSDESRILEIFRWSAAWYDGTHSELPGRENEIPIESRMLAIADAFDSMTSDQIFRKALTTNQALAELKSGGGTQFDPELVANFCDLQTLLTDQVRLSVVQNWLKRMNPEQANSYWHASDKAPQAVESRRPLIFFNSLLHHMHDAVIFIDADLEILHWNPAAERMTGLTASATEHRRWSPDMVSLADHSGKKFDVDTDPIAKTLRSGIQGKHRLSIRGAHGKYATVTSHLIPVIGENGAICGVTVQWHDASGVEFLEEQVQSLHIKATSDPLTGISNRAEFDRAMVEFVQRHSVTERPCSLIICDIDFFKKINDTYGHQAGDEALIGFAAALRRHGRPGDVVARYGGEEFVILCANCDGATAKHIAERIREEIAATPQPMFGGQAITASFGVTELQAGDTPETLLHRADRALMQSKEMGRNLVTQLGTGLHPVPDEERRGWLSRMFAVSAPEILVSRGMKTRVPLKLAIEKVRGFVADHSAEVLDVGEDHIRVLIDGDALPLQRRSNDRAVPLEMEIQFSPDPTEQGGQQTVVEMAIYPRRNRDRRRKDAVERARLLMHSLQSYLVAYEFTDSTPAPKQRETSSWWKEMLGICADATPQKTETPSPQPENQEPEEPADQP
ncbi:MAG: diguanylate cyclase [Pirellulaceae bacterium]